MFDIGLNLTSSQFAKDRDEVVARAFAAGVKGLLLTGTNLHESEQAQQLAQRYDRCWSTAGVHPHDSSQWTAESGDPVQAGEDARSGGDRRMRSRFQP
jgi:TatD DNase family protein